MKPYIAHKIFLVIVVFAGIAIFVSERFRTSSPKPEHDAIAAYAAAQHFVEQQLLTPGSAKWPWVLAEDVTADLGDGSYRITSYVDSHNLHGALLRTHFVCTVKYVSRQEWRCVSLTLRP